MRHLEYRARLLGIAFLLHALAHMSVALNATMRISLSAESADWFAVEAGLWVSSLLTAVAAAAFTASGLALLGVRVFRPFVKRSAAVGMFASLALLLLFDPASMLIGAPLGVALLYLLGTVTLPDSHAPMRRRPIAATAWLLATTGMALAIAIRPVFVRWGAHASELYLSLPGDEAEPGQGYQLLHAVTIRARPEHVWPWLAQIGHDRGGFYSYAWLENAFGLDIVNAERVVPEWQHRDVGELVPATPPNWLGLVREPLGWRVRAFEPDRLLALEDWGTFVLLPVDESTTRLFIRTLGHPRQRASLLTSPLEVLVFEPAHFIMQRRMMLGIRERAERLALQKQILSVRDGR